MKSKNKYGVIVFLITVLMISSGFGSMIVAERSDEIRFAYQSSHPYTYYALPLRSKYYAQKFYVPENVDFLTKFKIFCGDHANEGGFYEAGIKIDLYGGSIHAESGPLSSLGSLGWHEFYPADISVTPGSYYYLYFQVWTSVGVGSIGAGGNNYPNGELWEYDGSWSAISNRDMAFEVWGYTIPPRTITFYTNPTDGGTITFDGSTYSHGESVQKPDGQYPVIANPENNYDFDRWTTTGGINVANQYAQSTTATVTDDGTITAHFDYNPPNSPPETPSTPSGPSSGWHGTSYQYSTSTTDPNNDDVYYKWDWGDETSGWIGPYDSGETCYASHTWDEPNTYYVKVRAKDIHEAQSDWSPALQVYMGNRAPDTPNPPSGPISGWHCAEYQYSAYTTDPEDDDIYYKFDWGDGSFSTWLGPYDSGTACYETHTWTWPDTFHVRSKAKDIYNDESSWSQPLVITMDNRAPEQPSNPDPGHYDTWIDINADLSWTCTDPDGDCDDLHYDIHFGLTNPPPLEKENHQSTNYDPGQLQPGETYYWQIIAYDQFDGEREGPVWQFTTRVYHPPVLSNYDGWPEGVDREWGKCSDPFTFKVHYYDSDEDPPATKDLFVKHSDNQWYNHTMEKMEGDPWDTDYTITLNGSVFGGGEHYYYFLYNDGTISPDARLPEDGYWNFTVNYPPEKPDISGPNQLKKDVEYSFDARTTDENGDDIQYWFDWGDETNTNWVPEYFIPSGTIIERNHTWTETGTFEIRVKARDIHGDESPWGILEVTVPYNSLTINNLILRYLKILERNIFEGGL